MAEKFGKYGSEDDLIFVLTMLTERVKELTERVGALERTEDEDDMFSGPSAN